MLRANRSALRLMGRRLGSDISLHVAMEDEPRFLPGNGGTRWLQYDSEANAVADAYALCEHMRFKHRLYQTGFRGAKVVVRGPVDSGHRPVVRQGLAGLLQDLDGELYTGCDLNTGPEDMEWVRQRSRFVLAALDSPVDASTATGLGVVASFRGAMAAPQLRFDVNQALVHGVGATGSAVADALVAAGLQVYTVDAVPGRASRPGCIDISDDPRWFERPMDVFFPCSSSRLVHAFMAERLRCRLVVSAANDPLTEGAERVLDRRGIRWIPDPVSNAGAVIVDSIEQYGGREWQAARSDEVYRFVSDQIEARTQELVTGTEAGQLKERVELFADRSREEPVGRAFYAESRPGRRAARSEAFERRAS